MSQAPGSALARVTGLRPALNLPLRRVIEPSDRLGPLIAPVASVAQADYTPARGAGKQNPPRPPRRRPSARLPLPRLLVHRHPHHLRRLRRWLAPLGRAQPQMIQNPTDRPLIRSPPPAKGRRGEAPVGTGASGPETGRVATAEPQHAANLSTGRSSRTPRDSTIECRGARTARRTPSSDNPATPRSPKPARVLGVHLAGLDRHRRHLHRLRGARPAGPPPSHQGAQQLGAPRGGGGAARCHAAPGAGALGGAGRLHQGLSVPGAD